VPDVFFNLSPCSTQLKHPPEDTPPILERLNTDVQHLVYNTRHFESQFKGLVGTAISIKSKFQQFGYQRTPGFGLAELLT